PPAGGGEAELPVGEALLLDEAAERLAEALLTCCGVADDVVYPRGLLPQAELSRREVLGHVLGSAADQRELEVVDQRGPVGREVGHQSALYKVDQVARKAEFDRVGPQEEKHQAVGQAGNEDSMGKGVAFSWSSAVHPVAARRSQPRERGRVATREASRARQG